MTFCYFHTFSDRGFFAEDCEWGQWSVWSDPNDKGGELCSMKNCGGGKKRGLNLKRTTDMI